MTDDLVARLLEKARSGQAYGGVTLCEAADALEAQAKRIAELKELVRQLTIAVEFSNVADSARDLTLAARAAWEKKNA